MVELIDGAQAPTNPIQTLIGMMFDHAMNDVLWSPPPLPTKTAGDRA